MTFAWMDDTVVTILRMYFYISPGRDMDTYSCSYSWPVLFLTVYWVLVPGYLVTDS